MKILIWHRDEQWRRALVEEVTILWDGIEQVKVEVRVGESDLDTSLMVQQIEEFRPDLLIMDWGDRSKELLGDIRIRFWELPVWVFSERSPREIHHEAAKADLILGKDLFSRVLFITLVHTFLKRQPARAEV